MKRVSLFLFIAIIIASFIAQAESRAQAPASSQEKASQSPKSNGDKKEDCGCESKIPPDVLATVNGVKITIFEVDEAIKSQLQELRNRVIEARRIELDLLINSILLDREADKRGMSSNDLIRAEVLAKIPAPTEAEAQAFYNQNRAQIEGEFKDLKGEIINFLLNQRQREGAMQYAQRLRVASNVKVLVEDVFPPTSEADRARVLATINDQPVTSGDVEDSLRPLIADVQKQMYELRQRQVNLRINDMLLDQEAKKRNVTSLALLEAEINPKVKKVTEAEAQTFYEQNRENITGEFAQVKDKLIEYLQALERDKVEGEFAGQLRQGATIQVYLSEPEPPVYEIATDDQPWKGGASAPVTIIEFTDFECPACAQAQPILEELVKEYDDRVKLVVRDFPLDQHVHASKAAEAAEAAREQGKYWEYIALLFQNQGSLTVENLKEYATRLELDRQKFDEVLDSGKHGTKVRRDQQDGYRIGINSTPTVFVNGRRIAEKTRETLKAAIEAALKEVAKK